MNAQPLEAQDTWAHYIAAFFWLVTDAIFGYEYTRERPEPEAPKRQPTQYPAWAQMAQMEQQQPPYGDMLAQMQGMGGSFLSAQQRYQQRVNCMSQQQVNCMSQQYQGPITASKIHANMITAAMINL